MKTILRRLLRARAAGRARVLVRARGSGTASGGGGGFAAPTILTHDFDTDPDSRWNNAADQINWFPNASTGPNRWHLASATGGRGGGRCMQCVIPDAGYNPIGLWWNGVNDCYFAFWVRSTYTGRPSSSNIKFIRFRDVVTRGNYGGLHGENLKVWWDDENSATQFYSGLRWGAGDGMGADAAVLQSREPGWNPLPAVGDGNWHHLEVRYRRNVVAPYPDLGSPSQTVTDFQLWLDGVPNYLPNGTVPYYEGYPVRYIGGTAGVEPTFIRTPQSASTAIGGAHVYETISSSDTAHTVFLDRFAVSTQRIGMWDG